MAEYFQPSYYVTGLPRTRGAWLAHYLDKVTDSCEHEVGLRLMQGDKLTYRSSYGQKHVGVVDSSFPIWCKMVWDKSSPIVIINRNPLEVIDSLKKEFPSGIGNAFPYMYGEIVAEALLQLDGVKLLFNNVLEVDYDDMEDRMEDIVSHIGVPKHRFNKSEFEYMNRFKITVHPEKYLRLLDSGNISGRAALLFG